MVRPRDLLDLEGEEAEYTAWLSHYEMYEPPDDMTERIRPNPIRRVAKKHHAN